MWLHWVRRDDNQPADDLTNEKFDMFDPKFRIPRKGKDMEWRIQRDSSQGPKASTRSSRVRRKLEGQSPPSSVLRQGTKRESFNPGDLPATLGSWLAKCESRLQVTGESPVG